MLGVGTTVYKHDGYNIIRCVEESGVVVMAGDRAAEDGSRRSPCQAAAARLVTHAETPISQLFIAKGLLHLPAAATTRCARSQNGGGRPGCFLSDNQNVVIVRLILRRTQHTRACKPVPCLVATTLY